MQPIYLDNAATTPLAPEVREAMLPFLGERFGNPSSRHPLGVDAAGELELARGRVARACGARPENVVFTAGGTEANNLAVIGLARAQRKRGRHILLGPTEHPCVRSAALALEGEGFEVDTARLRDGACLDLEDLAGRLREDTVLVGQMLVNNEFGSLYPVAEVAALVRVRAPHARVHVDAVQALGKMELSLAELGVDSLAISAHKIHGPKGAGALVLEEGVRPRPLIHGGGQEHDLRSGTENVPGIVGLGLAAELAEAGCEAGWRHMTRLRELLREELLPLPGATLLDPGDRVVPAIAALRLPGPPAEVWMHHLEAAGVMTSVGSACQAKKGGVSPALLALGFGEEEARRVLRVSFSRETSEEEVRSACRRLRDLLPSLVTSTAGGR